MDKVDGWHFNIQNSTGEPRGDKLIVVRSEAPYLRLEIEAPGLRSLAASVRRRRALALIEEALRDLRARTGSWKPDDHV